MKKYALAFLALVLLLSAGALAARRFWRGETIPVERVCKKWGIEKFDISKFRNGESVLRAKMACDLLRNSSQFIGKDRSEIRKILGSHDGFYFSDMFPAYMIEVGADRSQDSWQVLFLLDRDEKVNEVVVHKNCCDR